MQILTLNCQNASVGAIPRLPWAQHLPVPSLFRHTLINDNKQREPMSSKTAGQTPYLQVRRLPSEVRAVLSLPFNLRVRVVP